MAVQFVDGLGYRNDGISREIPENLLLLGKTLLTPQIADL